MSNSVVALILIVLGVALGGVMAVVTPEPRVPQAIEWLENPRVLDEFNLESEYGEFSNQSLQGRWTVVLFGFLSCPDICPTSMAEMAKLADGLGESLDGQSIDDEVAYVFVSVDPGRDSVEDVGAYARHFDDLFVGVTGADEELRRFAKGLGIQYKVSLDHAEYVVAHSITYSILNPDGVLSGRFRPGFDVSQVAQNIKARVFSGEGA